MKATIGRTVWYFRNEDLVPSPAVVINTHEDTDNDLLLRDNPHSQPGSVHNGMTRSVGAPITGPSPGNVDLKVDGLVKTYRVYNVCEAEEPTAGCWMWPPRE